MAETKIKLSGRNVRRVGAVAATLAIVGAYGFVSRMPTHRAAVLGQRSAVQRGKVLAAETTAPCAQTDYDQVCKQSAVAVPAKAGQSYVDPEFGVSVARITDQSSAATGARLSSDQSDQVFNADGSMFLVLFPNAPAHIFGITNDAAADLGALTQEVSFDGAQWDQTNPNVLYAVESNSTYNGIIKFTVQSRKPLVVAEDKIGQFGAMPYSEVLSTRLAVSSDGRYFAVAGNDLPDDQDDYDHVAVLDSRTGSSWALDTVNQLIGYRFLHFSLDQSGRYVILETTTRYDSDTDPTWFVWDVISNTTTQLNSTDAAFDSDYAIGNAEVLNQNAAEFVDRNLDNPLHYDALDLKVPQKNGESDVYDHYLSSALMTVDSNAAFVKSYYISYDISSKQLQHSSQGYHIYKIPGLLGSAQNLNAPDEVRYKGLTLQQQPNMPTDVNQWYYDPKTDALYVWLADDFGVVDLTNLNVFDWRPFTDEVVLFKQEDDSSWHWQRLLHHRMAYLNTPETEPRAFLSPDGKHLLFVSNWNGTLRNATDGQTRTDVFMATLGK